MANNKLQTFTKPLFIVFTLIAIGGFFIQIFYPNLYFSSQAEAQEFIAGYKPYDKVIFVLTQIIQVIIAPISHYIVGILGGVLYGPIEGGILNWIGRVLGHLAAYGIAFYFGRALISKIFNPEDLSYYQKLVTGTPSTLHLRLLILFAIIFLPFFPDDEISYLLGLAAFPFKWYLPVLLLGHLGGSFGLAYIGAGIDTKDTLFWVIFLSTIFLTVILAWAAWKLNKKS